MQRRPRCYGYNHFRAFILAILKGPTDFGLALLALLLLRRQYNTRCKAVLSSCCGSTWQKGRTSNNGIFPLRKGNVQSPFPNAASRINRHPMRRITRSHMVHREDGRHYRPT